MIANDHRRSWWGLEIGGKQWGLTVVLLKAEMARRKEKADAND